MKALVIDCGSTQATAAVVDRSRTSDAAAVDMTLPHGLNAATAPVGAFESLCRSCSRLIDMAGEVSEVYFYGAGCATEEICARVASELRLVFPVAATVEVATDMLGSARAMCGDEAGIVAILGTGSNSCLYDGTRIVANVSPLGFILGDEGSGAVLGRLFLGRVLKRQFSEKVLKRFEDAYPEVSTADVIARVYRSERPNAYLASFCPFISSCLDISEVNDFVTGEFLRFITYNLSHYFSQKTSIKVHFTGSIAYHFAQQLRQALAISAHNVGTDKLTLGKILRTPLPSLAQYHYSHPR